jgi:hypothetical protein
MVRVEVPAVQPMVGLTCDAHSHRARCRALSWCEHGQAEYNLNIEYRFKIAGRQHGRIGRRRNNPAAAGLLAWDQARDMTNDNTISIGWLLAGILTVSIVFNGIALALA